MASLFLLFAVSRKAVLSQSNHTPLEFAGAIGRNISLAGPTTLRIVLLDRFQNRVRTHTLVYGGTGRSNVGINQM